MFEKPLKNVRKNDHFVMKTCIFERMCLPVRVKCDPKSAIISAVYGVERVNDGWKKDKKR
ncbi:MAG: hypothetical protein IIY06_01585 [Proteobacteria bacterium]|nr:hypothetical protein [Pseudomonadota bacterium]